MSSDSTRNRKRTTMDTDSSKEESDICTASSSKEESGPSQTDKKSDDEDRPDHNEKEEGEKKDQSHGLDKVKDLYHRFVESVGNALHSVNSDGSCTPPCALKSTTLEGIAEFILKERPSNVVVMTGAGISTSAGIPDFRSPGSGLYDNLTRYNLPDPQAIFDIGFFNERPEPFFALAKELFPENLKPTPCHHFIKLLDKKGLLRRWYTQNIDSLEYMTGISEDKVVSAHGSHRTSTCTKCRKKYDLEFISKFLKDKSQTVPKCTACGGVVKPDIVFFGESLPKRFFQCAISDFPKCDLLIILGTSLVVQPFAGMVHEVADEVPRLLINLEEAGNVGAHGRAMGLQGLCYGLKENTRDVFWRGTCDDGVQRLAELLDWEHELELLIQEGEVKAAVEKSKNKI